MAQNGPMRLSTFIDQNLDDILRDWVSFAAQQLPAAASMDVTALLDHGRLILQEISADMGRPQDDEEQQAKSEGQNSEEGTHRRPSRAHARQRAQQGFEIEQMVAEYRALRATVLRLWSAHSADIHAEDLEDVTRFNEAVDQAIAESLAVFVAEVSRTNDLFLGVLGHDLRGPLSTIAAYAQVARRDHPQDAHKIAVVQRSVAQMKGLVDDLLAYTRQRLGWSVTIDPKPLVLDEHVLHTLQEIEATGHRQHLALATKGDMSGEWDSIRLHQAVSNLVFNALKYSASDTDVKVSLDGTHPDTVVLAVENQGKPIPAVLLPRLFDPLVRADGELASDDPQLAGANLGLGLYVVRSIAIAHGGEVEVSSDASATCFTLRLPRIAVKRGGGAAPAVSPAS
jgi:signal transduction histidine kinase